MRSGLLTALGGGAVLGVLSLGAPPAAAQSATGVDAVAAALSCREVVEDAARLACLDAAVAGLATAFPQAALPPAARQEAAREEARQRGIALFGLRLGADPRVAEVAPEVIPPADVPDSLAVSVVEASRTADDRLLVVLANGQVWAQSDSSGAPIRIPRSGFSEAEIEKKLFGGFSMRLDGGVWFRARRVQ
jgi:hypothetical protein